MGKLFPIVGNLIDEVAKLCSTYAVSDQSKLCDQSVFYAAGIYSILRKIDLKRIQSSYFSYCEFLLFIPPWTGNLILIGKYGAPDIILKLEKLHRKFLGTAPDGFCPPNHLVNFFL